MPWFDWIRREKWGEQDSNLRRLSQQIYSLPRLTASVPPQTLAEQAVRRASQTWEKKSILSVLFPKHPELPIHSPNHGLTNQVQSVHLKKPAEGLEPTTCCLQNSCSAN